MASVHCNCDRKLVVIGHCFGGAHVDDGGTSTPRRPPRRANAPPKTVSIKCPKWTTATLPTRNQPEFAKVSTQLFMRAAQTLCLFGPPTAPITTTTKHAGRERYLMQGPEPNSDAEFHSCTTMAATWLGGNLVVPNRTTTRRQQTADKQYNPNNNLPLQVHNHAWFQPPQHTS